MFSQDMGDKMGTQGFVLSVYRFDPILDPLVLSGSTKEAAWPGCSGQQNVASLPTSETETN